MELDYSVEPTLLQRVKPALQNWRLYAFVAVLCIPFAWMGYTLINENLSGGIHQYASYTSVDLKSMGNFPFNEQDGLLTDVPKEFRDLDGKRVELRGMMWDLKSAGPETAQFQFVYNIAKCCFNGPPRVQERVFVHCPNGAVRYYDQLAVAVGTLHVRVKRNEQGAVYSVYDMDLESIKPG